MENLKLKKLSLVILTVMLLCVLNTQVFATSNNGVVQITNTNSASSNTNSAGNTNKTNNTTNNTNTNKTNTPTYTNNTSKSIPKAGDGNTVISVIAIVAICGVSAVYAYKKIRDYNI